MRGAHSTRALVTLSIVGEVENERLFLSAVVVLTAVAACTSHDADEVALATQCMRASDDNRAKFSASWLSSAEIDIDGDLITVRTEVPAGISLDAKVRFRHWIYRCRKHGEQLEFLGFEAG